MTRKAHSMPLAKSVGPMAVFVLFFAIAATGQTPPTYPRMAGYAGILHPLVTFSEDGTTPNFRDAYVVGFPTGLNLRKSAKVGFSVEIVPTIRSEKGVAKMSNLLFHPGILLGLGKGFTFAGRAAFETGGRFGVTPVLNKAFKRGHSGTYFLALPMPVRFGNDHPASVTIGFQFGIGF
ncbi:hypothetical protein [Runella slithyformis]|uniref:Outer membrane protein beta-barrel domain-containing protein n=1 Tax=Runella slithyformis (strain ATCC 29530 / DSM 19594 / LMG 11500 / NCIMB 11436 / LSU 4) TaxID=761193 RepID=A0A7U3ZL18_RUNSL|nr:hypothetical protein [Runella slithyformis]AEI49175.1 hypothetical protein Runsl_2782 [Runella slithyformis DSM 19594]